MRTRANVHLDNDAYASAVTYAAAKGIALGAAISELIRQAERGPERLSAKLETDEQGYLVVAGTGNVITSEMVKKGSEDDLN